MQILLSCFVWIPLIAYLAALHSKDRVFMYFSLAGISLFSAYNATFNMSEIPYGLYGKLNEQKYLTQVNNTQLYLDSTSKYVIDKTREELKKCGFKPKDYLLSLTDVPGLTYAVEARSPACPWYFGMFPGGDKLAKFCLNLYSNMQVPYLLLDNYNGQQPRFSVDQMETYFKNFSKRYILCGEVKNIPTVGGVCCKVPIDNIKIFKLIELTQHS